jgi:GNAT superfamily N-acetyltransferase
MSVDFRIDAATERDVPVILRMIKSLADYEKLAHEVVATEEGLRQALFGPRAHAEVAIGWAGPAAVGYALFFHTFSTFRGAPGLWLEDLFVEPDMRGRGYGKKLLAHVAALAVSRGCHRFEWAVLDWNESAIGFYRRAGAVILDDWCICRITGEALARLAATAGIDGSVRL